MSAFGAFKVDGFDVVREGRDESIVRAFAFRPWGPGSDMKKATVRIVARFPTPDAEELGQALAQELAQQLTDRYCGGPLRLSATAGCWICKSCGLHFCDAGAPDCQIAFARDNGRG